MIDVSRRRQAEAALEESEGRYRGLFDHVPVGLYRSTPEGSIEDGNIALARMLGYPDRAALLEARVEDLYAIASDREQWLETLAVDGLARGFEVQLRRRDGSVIWARDSARAIRDHDDRIRWFEGVVIDITQQKQAEWEARQATQQLSGWVSELERRSREMLLVKQMGDMLQACPTAEEAYTVMAHWAEQLFEGRAGALCVIAPSRNIVEPVAIWGDPVLGEVTFAPNDCWALRTGRPHFVSDPSSRLRCAHLSEPLPGASMCVPMMAQGEALGILHLQGASLGPLGATPEFGEAQADQIVGTVAEHLALALANLHLRESLQSQSIRDPLTGLFNRRYMEESLEREFRRAERRGHSVGVIMLDLDHFNQFNNTFGHQAGDELLQAFGELFRAQIRAEDIACRYGGEEFVLILPEAALQAVRDRAERIREQVREMRVTSRGLALGSVTASLGVACYPEHGGTVDAVIRAADLALYEAKNLGRDRTETAGERLGVFAPPSVASGATPLPVESAGP